MIIEVLGFHLDTIDVNFHEFANDIHIMED